MCRAVCLVPVTGVAWLTLHDPRIAQVDRLLRRGGLSVRQIADETGVTWWRIYKYAKRHGIALWSKRLPLTLGQQDEAARLVETDGMSMAKAAAILGASEMQVWRVIQRRRAESVSHAGVFRPIRIREGKRCPRHGLVYYWPCVACQASGQPPKNSGTAQAVR